MTDSVTAPEGQPRYFRNDFGALDEMQTLRWEPALAVSVVIPAYGSQDKLDLVLAALSAQSYPRELLEVVVVDDGSSPPLRLPDIRPERTRLVTSPAHEWGIASAVNTGIEAAEGEIVLRVDADVLPSVRHVESHARWHHVADYLLVLGAVQFVIDPELAELSPEKVAAATAESRMGRVFGQCTIEESWAAERIRQTDRLRQLEGRAYSVANGASVSFRKTFWKEVGGLRTDLRLGEDTEFGYRIAQYGGVIVPEQEAVAWHLGASTSITSGEQAARVRNPPMANSIPLQRHLRKTVGRQWEVPFVEVTVDAVGADYESVKATVDSLLADGEADLSVTVNGTWSLLSSRRYSPLRDEHVDLRLLQQDYAADGRVALVEDVERVHPTAPFRLLVRPGVTIAPGSVGAMVDVAELRRVGMVNVVVTGSEERFPVVLERTAALSRAKRLAGPEESLFDAVDAVWGIWFASGDEWAVAPGAASGAATPAAKTATEVTKLREKLAKAEAEVSRQRERAEKWKEKSQNLQKMTTQWQELAETWRGRARSSTRYPLVPAPVRRLARRVLGRTR